MALQTTGPISLADVQTEFGGTNPISISEYYGVDTVPVSGIISLSDFYGTSAIAFTFVEDYNGGSSTASASSSLFTTQSNTGATYGFTELDGVWSSTNQGDGTSFSFWQGTFTVTGSCTLTWNVSSESGYDFIYKWVNGTFTYATGIASGDIIVNDGDVISIAYTKDESVNEWSDKAWFSLA